MRRCAEDRWDFGEKDNAAGMNWPVIVEKGGEPFGFCPGKATWDEGAIDLYRLMSLASESGNIILYQGAIIDQPDWWLENMGWFMPRYKHSQFVSRAKMILGDDKTATKAKATQTGGRQNGGNNRPTNR